MGISYDKFVNYGSRRDIVGTDQLQPFGIGVMETSGNIIPGTQMTDIRAQALRLDPASRMEMLRAPYKPKLSAGLWFFGEGSSRFHGSYKDEMPLEERLRIAAHMSNFGLKAVEAHYPWEINEDNVNLFEKLRKDSGVIVSVVAGIGGDFRAKDALFGTTSSPIKAVRDKYVKSTVDGLKFTKALAQAQGHPVVAVTWPGIDGYTYSIGTDFYDMWDRFEAALAESIDEVPGVRVAIEPKPYEPAINNIYRNTSDGIIMAHDVENRLRKKENIDLLKKGHTIVGLNPEIGHVKMGFEDVPYAYSRALREGRLAHTHLNAQPLGNYDQDLNLGVVGPESTEGLIYVLRMYGYKGFLGMDINPDKMPVQRALALCFNDVKRANAVVDNIDHEQMLQAYHQPIGNEGVIEALVTEARAKGMDTSKLIPLKTIRSLG